MILLEYSFVLDQNSHGLVDEVVDDEGVLLGNGFGRCRC